MKQHTPKGSDVERDDICANRTAPAEDEVERVAERILSDWLLPFDLSVADRRFNEGLRTGVAEMKAAIASLSAADDEITA
jgi:hypothetical protein